MNRFVKVLFWCANYRNSFSLVSVQNCIFQRIQGACKCVQRWFIHCYYQPFSFTSCILNGISVKKVATKRVDKGIQFTN